MGATSRAGTAGFLLLALMASPVAAKEEMLCPGTMIPLTLTATHSPYVRSSVSGQGGYFQVDTGASISTVDARRFRRPVGTLVLLDDFAFPTMPRGKFTALNFGAVPGPTDGPQIGQIGTDLMRWRTVEFHYEATPPYLVISDRPCSPEKLQAAGFVAISQQGYFGKDRSRLGGVTDNTPVVFMRIGGVTVPTWIDTGFVETNVTGTVQVNDLVLDKLRAAGLSLVPAGSGTAVNCHAEQLDIKLWRVVGATMQLTTEQDRTLMTYAAPILSTIPRNSCSGPGNIGVPVARIGAAYVNWWGTLVLDSLNGQVWLSPARARAPERPKVRRAMVVAQNKDGGLTITSADTIERAKADALAACGKGGGACAVKISIAPSELRCIAMARNKEHTAKLSLAERPSVEEAKQSAEQECARTTHGACVVQFTGCNE